MKAIVYHTYGSPDVLKLEDVEKPTPKDDEVLVRILGTSINSADWRLLNGATLMERLVAGGIQSPKKKILGVDAAGRVEAVGSRVKMFKVGDEVYGEVSAARSGGFAQYVAVQEKYLALKPTTLSFEEAATAPVAGTTALQGLRDKGKLQAGQSVLITGASGGVGSFAVQIAKYLRAEVTATCSTSKMDMVRSLGADRVVDYTREEVTQMGQHYDVIFDVAAHRPLSDYKPILNPRGIYMVAGGALKRIFGAMLFGSFASIGSEQSFSSFAQQSRQEDLVLLKSLLEAGNIVPVIDRCYTLNEIPEALRYFGEGRTRGKIAITVG